MYCSSCGSAVPPNLTYCNRCGAKVGAANTEFAESTLVPLAYAIVGLFVLGTGVIIGLMAVMKNVVGLPDGIILGITMTFFLLMLILELVLVWMLFSTRKDAVKSRSPERLKEHSTSELDEVPVRALNEPMTSVTEHTTRAFEPAYIRDKSK